MAVYRGIYIVYIGRLFVLGPKVGGRRGSQSKEGWFKGFQMRNSVRLERVEDIFIASLRENKSVFLSCQHEAIV